MPQDNGPEPGSRWDVLTKTGAGTPMGELLRRYWWPIAGASGPYTPQHVKVDFNEFEYGFQYKRIRTDTSDKDRLWTVGRVCLWPNGLFTGNHVEFRAKRVGSPEELGCGICDSRA